MLSDERQTARLEIRLSPILKAALGAEAHRQGLALSELVRRAIVEAVIGKSNTGATHRPEQLRRSD